MTFKKVGIITKITSPLAPGTMSAVVPLLRGRGIAVRIQEEFGDLAGEGVTAVPREEVMEGADLALVLGGDGTFLLAARLVENSDALLLGVNLGSLGFLTELSLEEMDAHLPRILAGDFEIEERIRLQADLLRGRESIGKYQA
ncbi:MAG: NAD(+)/NADH kinase, partial [Proteobacteria bacterium]|nr:NAD(+)/NADH kinase [Pseudomonadota bacterium]